MAAMTGTSVYFDMETIDVGKKIGEGSETAIGDAGRSQSRSQRASSSASVGKETTSENGKKKAKEEKPPTKVVIRRLPPSMTKKVFLNQISPVPEHDYIYFVQGDPTAGNQVGFSRAYINFIHQEDLFSFTETYDSYVFVDNKGQEYPAIVEFAPFQRIPKQRGKKKDSLMGSLETDASYLAFKESLEVAAAEAAKPDVTSKQHFFETEVSSGAPHEVSTTPLLEFLKQKKLDRARIRDERREEKKRKEAERKMRQKASKEKKTEAEEEPRDIKLLQSKDKKESSCKESRSGRRPDREKVPKENRPREFKNRNNKNYSDDKFRIEKKEEKKKEGGGFDRKDGVENTVKEDGKDKTEEENAGSSKSGGVEKRKTVSSGEGRRKYEGLDGSDESKKSRNDRNKSMRKERERRRRDDYLAKKNSEKRNNLDGGADRKRSRTAKSGWNESNEQVGKDKSKSEKQDMNKSEKDLTMEEGNKERGDETSRLVDKDVLQINDPSRRRNSLESTKTDKDKCCVDLEPQRRNSLESGKVAGFVGVPSERYGFIESCRQNKQVSEGKRDAESDSGGEKQSRRSREDKASKSDQDIDNKDKDPRTGRRIRNKDRPSIQIYRPGMGKLSKQRLEKEKVLGSSTEMDSPSHSPSPVSKIAPAPSP